MLYKKLGNTSVKISAVGIGTGFGHKEISQDRNKIISAIRAGIDLGLNFIDTGENYAEGICEEIVGKSIKGVREKVILSSKFSPQHSSFNDLLNACDMSLKRLGTNYIDLYQFHWPNPRVPLSETLEALYRLIHQGKIKYIGLGNTSKEDLNIILKNYNNKKIVSIQVEYNLFERFVEKNGLLGFCNKNNISLIAYSPLDQGRFNYLGEKYSNFIKNLCVKYGKTPAQIILNWLIARRSVVVIPKSKNINHLRENAISTDFKLSGEDIKQIDRVFRADIVHVSVDQIKIDTRGERGRRVYQSLDEAIENKMGYVPGPLELSESLKFLKEPKPVRLLPIKHSKFRYKLINGRIRYWAWRIAYHDKKPIPAYIRTDLNT